MANSITPFPLQVLNDDVLMNLYNLTKRSERACLLWAKLMMGYSERVNMELNGNVIHRVEFELKGSQSNLLEGLK